MAKVLQRFRYFSRPNGQRGLLFDYMQRLSGYSRQHLSRLIAQYRDTHSIEPAKYLRPRLATLDLDYVDAQIKAIEPIERRAGWLALRDGTYSASYLNAVTERLVAPLARLEKALQDGPWLAGPAFSTADIDAYPMLCVLPDLAPAAVNARSTPRIMEYLDRVAARESVRTALRTARTPHPERQFVPGIEVSRWV